MRRDAPDADKVKSDVICWVHFGDLHITSETDEQYADFVSLIEDANENLAEQIDFAFLPGDNADDGTEEQYAVVQRALQSLKFPGGEFSRLIRECEVELVEMGHTHYNELANDGTTIYAATRSTGQIEEVPPGFSITVVDGDVISWKFKERGRWPFVMITSPADYRLIRDAESSRQVVRGNMRVRAKVWGRRQVTSAQCMMGDTKTSMHHSEEGFWECDVEAGDLTDGRHKLGVQVEASGSQAGDEIEVLIRHDGEYEAVRRHEIDYEHVVGEWPEKGILGTQLGPNERGTKGPWPSWRQTRA